MTYFDWLAPPGSPDEYRDRLDVLVSCDVLQIFKLDPRDEIFGTLLYWHPDPVPMRAQIAGVFDTSAVITQLIVTDMINAGLVDRSTTGNLQITTKGLAFASARLVGPDVNSIYRVRDGAPSYDPLSDASTIALKHLVLSNDSDARFLIEDIYHPVLGRARFD